MMLVVIIHLILLLQYCTYTYSSEDCAYQSNSDTVDRSNRIQVCVSKRYVPWLDAYLGSNTFIFTYMYI